MDPFHERLARTGLGAADRYGFALAGGYAVQAVGFLERPSEDVDLFTAWDRRQEFTAAVAAVVHAYRDDGLTVETERQYDTFARLAVTDGVRVSKVELGVDWRANTREALLALAQRADCGFDRRVFADALGQATLLDPDDFAQYGVTGRALDDLRSRFADWRRRVRPGRVVGGPGRAMWKTRRQATNSVSRCTRARVASGRSGPPELGYGLDSGAGSQ